MHYPLRYPMSRVAARFGIPISISVEVTRDDEAGVYLATSADVPGLVLESDTLDALRAEVEEAILFLLDSSSKKRPKNLSADAIFVDHLALT